MPGAPQPQARARETASSGGSSPPASSSAPTQSTSTRSRGGDGGTNSRTQTIATSGIAIPSQKIPCQETWSTIAPLATRPAAPPTPKLPDSSPSVGASRSCGSVSRAIANESGKIAPPSPCSTRATISTGSDGASAPSRPPQANIANTATSIRSLPKRSPRRPRTGVETAVESRKAEISQATPPASLPRSRSISGSAGTTIICITA